MLNHNLTNYMYVAVLFRRHMNKTTMNVPSRVQIYPDNLVNALDFHPKFYRECSLYKAREMRLLVVVLGLFVGILTASAAIPEGMHVNMQSSRCVCVCVCVCVCSVQACTLSIEVVIVLSVTAISVLEYEQSLRYHIIVLSTGHILTMLLQ